MKFLQNPPVRGTLVTGGGAALLFCILLALSLWSVSYRVETSAGAYFEFSVPPLSLAALTVVSLAGVFALLITRAGPKLLFAVLGSCAAAIVSTIFLIFIVGTMFATTFGKTCEDNVCTYEFTGIPATILMIVLACASTLLYGSILGDVIQKKSRGWGPIELMPTALVNVSSVFFIVVLYAVIPLIKFSQGGLI